MCDSEDEDSFYDAVDYITIKPAQMDLATGIDDAKLAMNLFMNNHFEEARVLLKPWAKESMYHALGTGVFQFLDAVLTFERHHIEIASVVLDESVEVCDRLRKKTTVYESLGRMIKRPNYDLYTEVEVHAELCYAECLLLRAALTFIEDENLISFVRGGFRMRSCLNAYKECWQILKSRSWTAEAQHKEHFESGVRMGVGAYNLLISMLPSRIMKLLEFIGFSGNRDDVKETGVSQLTMGSNLEGSLRQILCTMVLLGFHLFVSYVLGYGDGDLELSERLINDQLSVFPDGVWYNFFKARLEFVKGNISDSITWYHRAWESQSEWIQFHHLCYWELMWANCFKKDWSSARDFASLLLCESRWSKVIYGYQKASFQCMMFERLPSDEKDELLKLFTDIPGWKQRIAGKSIPMEKFAVKKSERFFAQGNMLVLPAIELLYLWNGFKIIGKQPALVKPLLQLIQDELSKLTNEKDTFYVDNLCLLKLLQGMCTKYTEGPKSAQTYFQDVIRREKTLKNDTYLVPYATYELAVTYWAEGKVDLASSTLESAFTYKGYSLESRLHFRIHSALADLRSSKKSRSQLNGVDQNAMPI